MTVGWARSDPGFCGFSVATLPKAIHEFRKPGTQNAARGCTREAPAKLLKDPRKGRRWDFSLKRPLGSRGGLLSGAAKPFGDFVPVLIPGAGE